MTAEQYLNLKPGDKVRVVAPKTNIGKTTKSTIPHVRGIQWKIHHPITFKEL